MHTASKTTKFHFIKPLPPSLARHAKTTETPPDCGYHPFHKA